MIIEIIKEIQQHVLEAYNEVITMMKQFALQSKTNCRKLQENFKLELSKLIIKGQQSFQQTIQWDIIDLKAKLQEETLNMDEQFFINEEANVSTEMNGSIISE